MESAAVLVLGSGLSPTLALGLGLVAVAIVIAGYRRALGIRDYGPWVPRTLLGLRVVAVVLLLLLLVNPILRIDQVPPEGRRVAVLVDTSRSMAIRDSLGGASRLDTAGRILREGVLEKLGRVARPELHAFDSDLHPLDPAQPPPAAAESSDLAGAVSRVTAAREAAPLAAVVMMTDGCETGARSVAELAPGVPVYAVGLGSLPERAAEIPDVALSDVRADRKALLHTRVDVRVGLRSAHLQGETVTAQVRQGEQVLAQQAVRLGADPQEVSLSFLPGEAGLHEFEARVVPHPRETIVENNSRFFAIHVESEKLRVFYYEGTPRWEYKFLTRELKNDAHLALQAVLRTNVDRAYQSGGAGDPAAVFPAGRQALRPYGCVILGDLRAQDLTREQAAAVRDYVEQDGGGLIVLAGKESLAADGLAALGLEPLLPVSLAGAREVEGGFDVRATPEGVTHPALAGFGRLLPIESVFAVGPVKPGAQLLLKAEGGRDSLPLAIAQRYGAGRVFFFASDADWKWGMKHQEQGGQELFVRLWGQIVRWAANRDAGAPARSPVVVSTDKDVYRPGETVRVRVQGAVLPDAREADAGDEKIALHRSLDRLEGAYVPRRAGVHAVKVGDATAAFFVERGAGEFDRIALNETPLRRLAASSGGRYFDAVSAKTLPDVLQTSGTLKVTAVEYAFNESWLPFVATLLALAAEWSLRKRMQVM